MTVYKLFACMGRKVRKWKKYYWKDGLKEPYQFSKKKHERVFITNRAN